MFALILSLCINATSCNDYIIEPVERVTDYDFTCPFIPESDIP